MADLSSTIMALCLHHHLHWNNHKMFRVPNPLSHYYWTVAQPVQVDNYCVIAQPFKPTCAKFIIDFYSYMVTVTDKKKTFKNLGSRLISEEVFYNVEIVFTDIVFHFLPSHPSIVHKLFPVQIHLTTAATQECLHEEHLRTQHEQL